MATSQSTDGAEKARLSTLQIEALSTTHTHFADQEKMVLRTQLADERRENAKLREELKEAKTALEESRQKAEFGREQAARWQEAAEDEEERANKKRRRLKRLTTKLHDLIDRHLSDSDIFSDDSDNRDE